MNNGKTVNIKHRAPTAKPIAVEWVEEPAATPNIRRLTNDIVPPLNLETAHWKTVEKGRLVLRQED
jgi:hypothetical protein